MQYILNEIDTNITRKKIKLMNKELYKMRKEFDIMDEKLDTINKIYAKILYKEEPVGSGSNAIKYLKLQR
mgnify:CR=1 FL=1